MFSDLEHIDMAELINFQENEKKYGVMYRLERGVMGRILRNQREGCAIRLVFFSHLQEELCSIGRTDLISGPHLLLCGCNA